MADPERIVAGFARALRAHGLSVPTGTAVLFAEALALVGVDDPHRVYWAGRATLVRRIEDVPVYDRVFAAYWQDRPASVLMAAVESTPLTLAVDDEDGEPDAGEGDEPTAPEGDVLAVRYSAVEVLRDQDLSGLTPAEWAEAQRLISALGVAAELRPSRRTRPSRRRRRGPPDLRATVRRNMRTGGVPIRRSWRSPVERPRRLVLLLDVSGSMEPYARGLARFAHAAVMSRRSGRVEVFTIGTRLTRITRELARRDPDTALTSAAQSVRDWSGGTRLGESLQEFNDAWGVRGLARGAIVVICSDGWDRGDPALIGSEMRRLSRVARRVVWVNPLKASPGYAPLARGMAAALPFVDQFVEGHAVSSLERLAEIIAGNQTKGATPAVKDLLTDIERWRGQGKRVALARVVGLEGSGPRLPGAAMVVSDAGEVAGSVSGGCVEGAVVTEALDVLAGGGPPRLCTFGYSDDEAFAVGLTCGGTIRIFVEPLDW